MLIILLIYINNYYKIKIKIYFYDYNYLKNNLVDKKIKKPYFIYFI